jgi:hypothetical protein
MSMSIKKFVRLTIGSNLLIALTLALLPALLITQDISILQSAIDYLNKD